MQVQYHQRRGYLHRWELGGRRMRAHSGCEPDIVYRQSPVASRLPAVNQLEKKLLIM
jgi:hypothetical protein